MTAFRFIFSALALAPLASPGAGEAKNIAIETEHSALVLRVTGAGMPNTVHHGKRFQNAAEYALLPDQQKTAEDPSGMYASAYTPAGSRNLLEPAIQVTHADGNPSLDLKYEGHETKAVKDGVTLTTVRLKDPQYPFEVALHYQAFVKEDVIEQWTTIRNGEKGAVKMQKYASANLFLPGSRYFLTHFHGDWAKEMQPEQVELTAGIKILDSKLGTRANLFQPSSFLVGLNAPAREDEGEVLGGTLAWTGNFQVAFEVDPLRNLRLLAGINPYASEYVLEPDKEFTTPSFIHTWSDHGTGQASRNLHRWARKHRVLHGEGKRLTLLNNWEATYFDFDEEKLKALFKDGKKLGTDVFLLDDGWFGNKYPRNDDKAGLGDWQENRKKLPHGIGYLVKEAEAAGTKFGIWLEPEMVNPKSELFEKHPDWVILLPNREPYYYRNQLVLDLSNPEVQEFVYGIVDKLLTENPTLSYIKWDCNAVIYNAHSATNPHPSNVYVEYVKGFYSVMERLRQKFDIPIMLCSGGGGRVDYGGLKYFTEFWPSDNTDPLERVYMQWDYSHFFPSITMAAHVTDWGKQPIKFRTDVTMMGKMGYDIVVSKLDEKELSFSQEALKTYGRLSDVIWHGDLFRLVSPYGNDFASLSYVSEAKDKAVWFNYLVNPRYKRGTVAPVKLKGLDPAKTYTIRELNVYPGSESPINGSPGTWSGEFLMTVGFNPQVTAERASVVLEIAEAK